MSDLSISELFQEDSQFADDHEFAPKKVARLPKLTEEGKKKIATKRKATEDIIESGELEREFADKSPAPPKNILALDTNIEGFAEAGFFNFPTKGHQYFGGEMYSLRQKCYILIESPERHAVFKSKLGNTQQTLYIDHPALLKTCDRILGHAVATKFYGLSMKEAQPFYNFAEDFKVFDMEKKCLTDFDWKKTCRVNFLLRIYGYYTYEQTDGQKKVKLISKIVQAKVIETLESEDVCLI